MKKLTEKREGFYMAINAEERELINNLQEEHAINISQAFKLFLKQMKERLEKSWEK